MKNLNSSDNNDDDDDDNNDDYEDVMGEAHLEMSFNPFANEEVLLCSIQ